MAARILGALALLALCVGPVWAETLGQLLKARGAPPLYGLQACGVLDDEQDLPVERFPGGLLARVHAERWGRLEAFRELRAARGRWDGRGEPPAELHRNLAGGLARVRNMQAEAHVAAALANEPTLAALVGPALTSRPAPGQDAQSWLVALDARWADPETWKRLGRAVAVPEEFTEVVYVYTGLRRPDTMKYRELLRRDFETRFGPGAPRRALEGDVLRQIFRIDPD